MLYENVEQIRQNVSQACQQAERKIEDVTVVVVTKSVDVVQTEEILQLGFHHLGENRVDAFLNKKASLDSKYQPIWHFIGNLQRRKVKKVINEIDYFHALDSLSLAEEIEKRAEKEIKCFMEVNVSGESTKHGFESENIEDTVQALNKMSKIKIVGLMTMAPKEADDEQIRCYFAALRQLQEKIQSLQLVQVPCTELSMGMSRDYQLAILEGATYVRIGTAFFK